MNTIGLFSGFSMYLAWTIYALIGLLARNKRTGINLWLVLGLVGALFLSSFVIEYGIAWSGGFLGEQIAHANRANSYWPIFMGFEFFVSITTTLMLFPRIRNNKQIRASQLFLIVVYLLAYLLVSGFRYSGFAARTLPGFYATTVTIGNEFGVVFWLAVMILTRTVQELIIRSKN